jgi:hypothetical protein
MRGLPKVLRQPGGPRQVKLCENANKGGGEKNQVNDETKSFQNCFDSECVGLVEIEQF